MTTSAAIDLSVAGFTSELTGFREDAEAEAAAMDMSEATDEGDVDETAEDCRAAWTTLELGGCCWCCCCCCCCSRLLSIEGSEEFTW